MPLILTTEEQKKVTPRRKPDRPSYYSAAAKQKVQIGEDFEAFLILSGSDKLREVAEWITTAGDLVDDAAAHDGLLKEWLDNETSDLSALADELESDADAFASMENDLVSSPKFGAIPETQQMLKDLKAPAAVLFSLQERTQHRQVLLNTVLDRLYSGGAGKDQRSATISWSDVLLSY